MGTCRGASAVVESEIVIRVCRNRPTRSDSERLSIYVYRLERTQTDLGASPSGERRRLRVVVPAEQRDPAGQRVIDADAASIERSAIRVACVKSSISGVGKRICIQYGLNRRRCILAVRD